jgi:hypothetical protein
MTAHQKGGTAGDSGDARAEGDRERTGASAGLSRRAMLEVMAIASLATACEASPAVVEKAKKAARDASAARANGGTVTHKFFTSHEWDTVEVLVDLIIPRDERSGSATDAGVPAFMDFILDEYKNNRLPIRGGLAWLDRECTDRFGATFVDCSAAQRTAVLDDIAWPKRAKPEHSQGVAFFNRFRDLTASGFWSSKMGVEDLQYIGNVINPDWKGCPPEALKKLGVG